MFIGICTIELRIEWANSLKDKRMVIKSLIDKVRARYNVSIAETDCQDQWRTAVLGLAAVSSESGHVNKVLDQVVRFMENNTEAEFVSCRTEII